MDLSDLQTRLRDARADIAHRSERWDTLPANAPDSVVDGARMALDEAVDRAERLEQELSRAGLSHRISVDEPDMYQRTKGGFLQDLYLAQLRGDPAANERISRHQQYELEKRAVSTTTLGGIIPPQYLVDMYAKASRNGRVFADQCNGQPLPDEGMSLIIPRVTTGTTAGVQAAEGDALATQDPVESDLTVPVRTIGGYIPVSRQTLERAAYSEAILFEDLLARYWAELDSQLLTGTGSSGQITGVFNTSGVVSLYAGDNTIATLWSTLADAQQQIASKWGGLGILPAKIFMHPRRWGQIASYLDDNGRPLFGYNNMPVFNMNADGSVNEYGFVGNLQGLPVYTDANMPTDLATNTNEDAIVITSNPPGAPLCWERDGDPVTLSFEQEAGTSLQVQLIAYGYCAFSAGRYPDATAVIEGFLPPSF